MISCDSGVVKIKGVRPVLLAELETLLIAFINDDEVCGLEKAKEVFNNAVKNAPLEKEEEI